MFFSESSECDDGGVGIAGDAVDVGVGSEVREGIEVPELGELGHSLIVTIFAGVGKRKTPWKTAFSGRQDAKVTHTNP